MNCMRNSCNSIILHSLLLEMNRTQILKNPQSMAYNANSSMLLILLLLYLPSLWADNLTNWSLVSRLPVHYCEYSVPPDRGGIPTNMGMYYINNELIGLFGGDCDDVKKGPAYVPQIFILDDANNNTQWQIYQGPGGDIISYTQINNTVYFTGANVNVWLGKYFFDDNNQYIGNLTDISLLGCYPSRQDTFVTGDSNSKIFLICLKPTRDYQYYFKILDINTNKWSDGPDVNMLDSLGIVNIGFVLNRIVVFGYHDVGIIKYIDYLSSNEWILSNAFQPYTNLLTVTVNDKLYLIGSYSSSYYDPKLDEIVQSIYNPDTIPFPAAVFSNNKIYVASYVGYQNTNGKLWESNTLS